MIKELKKIKFNLYVMFAFLSIIIFNSCQATEFVEGKLTGQLGNQMFVIAATVGLALDNNAEPIFPDLVNRLADNTPVNFEKVFFRLKASKTSDEPVMFTYKEPSFCYSPLPYMPNMELCGYFQTEKYFVNHKDEILRLFAPHPIIDEYLTFKYKVFLSHPNTVSIHLRSYADHDPDQNYYIQYGKSYFEKAVALFPQETLFLVFSNDMQLCKKEFEGLPGNFYFVEGEPHYHDIYLMSMCKHNIICNSSYSWWGAYLNFNPEKIIISPPRWFASKAGLDEKDLIPEGWIVLND